MKGSDLGGIECVEGQRHLGISCRRGWRGFREGEGKWKVAWLVSEY